MIYKELGLVTIKKSYVDFVNEWSTKYDYPNDDVYYEHLPKAMKSLDSLEKLIHWKNGPKFKGNVTKSKEKFLKMVRANYKVIQQTASSKPPINLNLFEKTFQPRKRATWRIFILHTISPDFYPIYDRHVHRAYNMLELGKLENAHKKEEDKYQFYLDVYTPWFNNLKKTISIDQKIIDNALMAYGQYLEKAKKNLK